MAISHKELLEQVARMKALREAAPIRPGRAEDYAPLALDTDARGTSPVLSNVVDRVGASSQKASQHQSLLLENERNFQQYVRAQQQMQRAQESLRRAQKMQQLQAQYSGGRGGGNFSNRLRGQKNIPASVWSQSPHDHAHGRPGKIVASSGKGWKDPTPVNLGAGLKTVGTPYGRITVNSTAADNFVAFLRALNRTGYKVTSLGSYANRNIAGTNTKSLHSYGLAIDINPAQNPVTYGKVITNLPKGIGRLAAKYGLAWGGQWNGAKKDPMHFSIPAYGTK